MRKRPCVLKEERGRGKNFLINAIVRWTGSDVVVITCVPTGSTLLNALDIVRRMVTKMRERLCGYEEQNRKGERGMFGPDDGRCKRSKRVCQVHFYLFRETAPLTKRPDKRIRRDRAPVSKKRSVTSSSKRREEAENREGERERRAEFRSLAAGEVFAKQLGERGTESDVSSACALEHKRRFTLLLSDRLRSREKKTSYQDLNNWKNSKRR